MSSSCSDDDSDAPIISTQFDDGLNLDDELRQRREKAQRQRQEQIEQRRRNRQRELEERKRKQMRNSRRRDKRDNSDDDASSAGSADLLASPPSSPSPPNSPVGRSRKISNTNKTYNGNNNNNRPLKSASAKVNSSADNSPSSILKYNNKKKGDKNNNNRASAKKDPSPTTHVKWKPKYNYDSSSDDDDERRKDTFRSGRDTTIAGAKFNIAASNSNSDDATKVTSERRLMNAKMAAAKRFGSADSDDSSDDGFEAMKKAMRLKKEKEAAAAAAKRDSPRKRSSPPDKKFAPSSRPALDSSPPQKMEVDSTRGGRLAAASALGSGGGGHRRLLAKLQESDDDSDDMLAGFRQMKAKKEAEERAKKEAARKRNPMALERYEKEQRDERRRNSPMKKTVDGVPPNMEGKEIVLGDEIDVKSLSSMGDDARGGRGGDDDDDDDGFIPTKPSRGIYKRRENGDDVGSPSKKRRGSGNPSSSTKGRDRMVLDSEDDGLWDDSDHDEKMNTNNDTDSGSDVGGGGKAKAKRGRGRPRASNGSSNHASKRKVANNNNSDEDSDAPARQKKKAPARKTARRRRSNSDSDSDELKKRSSGGGGGRPWSSRFDIDEDEKSDVSEDEKERAKQKLKPEFDNPKLGPPGPLVPFVLSKTWKRGDALIGCESDEADDDGDEDRKMPAAPTMDDGDDVDKVPASINRYLKEYQREGVQFIYASVIHGKGCILGDDMGLGKTVQMISLIAALLKKTGTGLDQLEIKQHSNKVKKVLRAREESKHQALLTGFGIKNESELETPEPPMFTPILIIAPSSVVENWQNEFKTWGHFNVGIYSGSNREKALERIKNGLDFILIAGKSLFTRAGDFDQLALVEWKLLIVDEYHEFKNGKSQGYMRLADIRDRANCPVIGMTGTLMQNKHEELFYLIDLVRPSLLGDIRAFRDEISNPITYARAKDAKQKVLDLAEKQEQVLRNIIKPAFLERKKEVVLKDDLMEKKEEVVFCELTEIQKKIYRHILSLPDYQQLRFANAPCDCGVNRQYFRGYKKMKTHKEQLDYQRRNKSSLALKKECCYKYPWNPFRGQPGEPMIDPEAVLWRQSHEKVIGCPSEIAEDILDGKYVVCSHCPGCTTLAAMHKLHKISSHPNLIQVDRLDSPAEQKKKLEFAKVALPPDILRDMPGGSYYKSDGIMDDHMKLSGKMRTLDYCLTKYLKRRNRVLVFSYSTAALDVIQNHVKVKGWTNMRLDGRTPTNQRQALVDKFQNGDTEIFLISTKAGGLGLNLTAANKVIIFDVNWNPSYDEQAQDRAFRIGQKRNVQIVRLVARGTIEELMYARQVYKVQLKKQTLGHNTDGKNQPQLFRGVAKDKNRKGELFGLENLLKFKDGSFMSSLWKAADDPNATHDINDLTTELENMDEDKLEDIAEEGDEGPGDSRKNPNKSQRSDDDDDSDDDDEFGGAGGKINHEDLFAQAKGGAKIAKGDDDFDEEMGGESQIVEVATKFACEDIASDESESEEEEIDDNAATPNDYVPPCIKDDKVKPENVKPEPASSLSNLDVKPAAVVKSASEDPPIPSPVKSLMNNIAAQEIGVESTSAPPVPSPVQSSTAAEKEEKQTEEDDDDKTVDIEKPSPVKSSTNLVLHDTNKATTSTKTSKVVKKPDSSDDELSPLRTQPTTIKKKKKAAKIQLMGNIFDTRKDAGTKSSGLHLPSYSRKKK